MSLLNYIEYQRNVSGAACNFIEKEALAQVFSGEFCENFQNTYCYRTPPIAGSLKSSNSVGFKQLHFLGNTRDPWESLIFPKKTLTFMLSFVY